MQGVQQVLQELGRGKIPIRGDLIVLAGNIAAGRKGQRFVDEDLNRVWQRSRVEAILASIRAAPPEDGTETMPMVGSAELKEQRELLVELLRAQERARGPVYVLDLHTTSSEGPPFTTIGDTLRNRALARRLPVPVVLGLEEQIDGPMLAWFDHIGWCAVGFEGGQHEAPESTTAHEDAVWLFLEAVGVIDANTAPGHSERRERLRAKARGLPFVVDVRRRHEIREDDEFRMRPGFRNFDRVRADQVVGDDKRGPVVAGMTGRIFMPLYQKLGDDGFFVTRRLSPTWLRTSQVLRRCGMDRLATWLPGVFPHPERDDAVVLSSLARNRVVVGLLHLLGFHRRATRGRALMVRRPEGREGTTPRI